MIYEQAADGKYYSPDGEPMPAFKQVGASRLEVGSIIFLRKSYHDPFYSAAVTLIERVDKGDSVSRWQVTVVNQSGGVEVIKAHPGGKDFRLQCSDEEIEALHERQRNIVLRRRIAAINAEVCATRDALRSMTTKAKKHEWEPDSIRNPKVRTYVQRFEDFAAELQAIYEEIGRDLGIANKKDRVDPEG